MYKNQKTWLIVLSLLCIGLIAALLSMYYHTRYHTDEYATSEEQFQPGTMRGSGRGMLIARLGLDPEQILAFDELRANYQQQTQDQRTRLSTLRAGVVTELMRDKPDNAILLSYATQIGEAEALLKGQTLMYMAELKKLCKPDQIEAFAEVVSDLLIGQAPGSIDGQGRGYRHRYGRGNQPR